MSQNSGGYKIPPGVLKAFKVKYHDSLDFKVRNITKKSIFNAVLTESSFTASEIKVYTYLTLFDCINFGYYLAWPSQNFIATELKLSIPSVARAIKKLSDFGYIFIIKYKHAADVHLKNIYILLPFIQPESSDCYFDDLSKAFKFDILEIKNQYKIINEKINTYKEKLLERLPKLQNTQTEESESQKDLADLKRTLSNFNME